MFLVSGFSLPLMLATWEILSSKQALWHLELSSPHLSSSPLGYTLKSTPELRIASEGFLPCTACSASSLPTRCHPPVCVLMQARNLVHPGAADNLVEILSVCWGEVFDHVLPHFLAIVKFIQEGRDEGQRQHY